MYRSMMFLSKSQDSKFVEGMSNEEREADKAAFDESLEHMKKFAGSDMEYVMMLKDKMIARGNSGIKSLKETVTLLTMLLQGSEEEREAARKTIKDMRAEKVEMTAEEKEE